MRRILGPSFRESIGSEMVDLVEEGAATAVAVVEALYLR